MVGFWITVVMLAVRRDHLRVDHRHRDRPAAADPGRCGSAGGSARCTAAWPAGCSATGSRRRRKFQPGSGILGRLDRRLRDRAAWRGVCYSLIKLPVAAVQLYTACAAVIGLVDVSYPADWLLFHHQPGDAQHPMVALSPLPFGGNISIDSWPGTFLAPCSARWPASPRTWLARAVNAGDRRLIRGLLGPSRVSELERTRTLAVEDSAAALRRVERDLHDGAQMRLAALAMNLGMAREKLSDPSGRPRRTHASAELIDAAHRNAMDALADLRDLARGIHPPVLDNGLASALASLAASSAIPASVTADSAPGPRRPSRPSPTSARPS